MLSISNHIIQMTEHIETFYFPNAFQRFTEHPPVYLCISQLFKDLSGIRVFPQTRCIEPITKSNGYFSINVSYLVPDAFEVLIQFRYAPESVLHTLFSFLKETESSFPYPTGMHFLPFRHPRVIRIHMICDANRIEPSFNSRFNILSTASSLSVENAVCI